jgi:hypothetical protein
VNPSFRKVALIAASLGLLVSLFFALRPGGDKSTTPTTAAPATTAPTRTTPAEPGIVRARITVSADAAPKVKKLSVRKGRQIELVIDSALADEVHVHGYDLAAEVAPGKPATIAFKATATGLFEIELESRHLPIAELEVRP